jgi:hypothetical protein
MVVTLYLLNTLLFRIAISFPLLGDNESFHAAGLILCCGDIAHQKLTCPVLWIVMH